MGILKSRWIRKDSIRAVKSKVSAKTFSFAFNWNSSKREVFKEHISNDRKSIFFCFSSAAICNSLNLSTLPDINFEWTSGWSSIKVNSAVLRLKEMILTTSLIIYIKFQKYI